MARFTATVRLLDLEAPDHPGARRELEAKLRAGAVGRYQIITVEAAPSPLPHRAVPRARAKWYTTSLGPVLLLGAILWALWFYWLLFA